MEKQFEHKVKALRTDRGGEFLSKEFDRYLADHGIRRQLTTAHTPSQNGVAERKCNAQRNNVAKTQRIY